MRPKNETTRAESRKAFTLIEIMVVIAIILVVLGAIVHLGQHLVTRGKERETSAILQKLSMAAEEFTSKKPLGKLPAYLARYENFPPDELDGFSSNVGVPLGTGGRFLSPSGSDLTIGGSAPDAAAINAIKYGDIKAFALSVRLFSEKGAVILDEVASKYRKPADKGPDGVPEYMDRNSNNQFNPGVDEPLDYFVDGWGTPIAYFSVHDSRATDPTNPPPGCFGAADGPPAMPIVGRLWASRLMVQLNNTVPFFVSYGADGPEQFSTDFSSATSREAKDLVLDYAAADDAFDKQNYFDNRFNQDNVYSHEGLKEKIAAYQPP